MSQLPTIPQLPYPDDFPHLARLGWRQTSNRANYNCIAFAAGDERRWWWPGNHPPNSINYWPVTGATEATLANFYTAFATRGYSPCPDGTLEIGYEKVAFYALNGKITHAAKQQQDGTWKSKLGKSEDISHTLEGLVGPAYGEVTAFAERPLGPIRRA